MQDDKQIQPLDQRLVVVRDKLKELTDTCRSALAAIEAIVAQTHATTMLRGGVCVGVNLDGFVEQTDQIQSTIQAESDFGDSCEEEWGDASAWTEDQSEEYLITEDPDWYHNFSWIRTGFDPKFDSEGKEVWGVAEIPLNQGWYSTKDCLPSLSDDQAGAGFLVRLLDDKISVAHLVQVLNEGHLEYNWLRQSDALPGVTHWRFIGIMPMLSPTCGTAESKEK